MILYYFIFNLKLSSTFDYYFLHFASQELICVKKFPDPLQFPIMGLHLLSMGI